MLEKDSHGNYFFTNIEMVEGEQNFKITMEGIQNLKEGVYLYSSEVRTEDSGEEVSSQTLVGIAEGQRAVDVSMNIEFVLDVEDVIVATEHVWREETTKDPEPPKNEEDDPEQPKDEEKDPLPPQEDNTPQDPVTPNEPEEPSEPERTERPERVEVIEDNDVPLSPTPVIEIEDEEVPLSDMAVLGATYFADPMVPLGVLPATSDHSVIWTILTFLSGLSLAGVSLKDIKGRKKNRKK